MKQSHRILPIDMDGNELGLFRGYDCPSFDELFKGYGSAVRIVVKNRNGDLVETIWRNLHP